jgi:hypothetical protein
MPTSAISWLRKGESDMVGCREKGAGKCGCK